MNLRCPECCSEGAGAAGADGLLKCPHFHAQHADGHAKVRIDNLEPIESSLPRRQLRFVLAWAELHQAELEENWRLAREGGTLRDVEPLR